MEEEESQQSSSTAPKDTGYVPGNDSFTRWRNTFALLTGQLTPEGKEQYRQDRDIMMEKTDCQRCEKHRDYLLKYSTDSSCFFFFFFFFFFYIRGLCADHHTTPGPIIRFMSEKTAELHGSLNSDNIRCRRCTRRQGGGFSADYGILICANEMRNRKHLEDTLAHEMIHAYDYLRFKVDWPNLRHSACTEVE